MTKADLTREISQQTGIERAIVALVIEGVMEGIKSSLIGERKFFFVDSAVLFLKRGLPRLPAISPGTRRSLYRSTRFPRSNPARILLKKSDDLNKTGLSRVP